MASFNDLMKTGFGVVTVMDAKIYTLGSDKSYTGPTGLISLGPADFQDTGASLNSLKIANLNLDGPNKTATGGKLGKRLIRWGKTGTIEMQDALGSKEAFQYFYGAKFAGDTTGIFITNEFSGPIAIEGKTLFIDRKTGDEVDAYIFIPWIIPESIFNFAQDVEGDVAVFDLNGTLGLTNLIVGKDATDKDIIHKGFYRITASSFFADGGE